MLQERDDSEQLVRELMRKTKKLQEEQAAAEQSLKVGSYSAHHLTVRQSPLKRYLNPPSGVFCLCHTAVVFMLITLTQLPCQPLSACHTLMPAE